MRSRSQNTGGRAYYEVTRDTIDVTALIAKVESPACGALASFIGVVRDRNNDRPVSGVFYECYDAMAEREIATIAGEVAARDGVGAVSVVHRVGELSVGDASLAVVVSAPHRDRAFEAVREVVEAVKSRAPIWKKERYADDGSQRWLGGGKPEE